MRHFKPQDNQRRLRSVDVDLHWQADGSYYPVRVYYPLWPIEEDNNPETVREYKVYTVTCTDMRSAADPDLGVAGTVYTVDVDVDDNKTVRTVLWHDEEKFYISEKVV